LGAFIDLTGQVYGILTVLEFDKEKSSKKRKFWICKCECGNIKSINGDSFRFNTVRSCGCLRRERWHKIITKHNLFYENKRLYNIYTCMKQRCYNENDTFHYKYYGGRGIKVCDEWLDKETGFVNFLSWALSNGYKDNLTIDRIDVNGNYEPSNCRWATYLEQANNTRNKIILLEHNNEIHSLNYWSKKFNINHVTAWRRYYKGLPFEDIFGSDKRFKESKGVNKCL
jgi:hypothetical protein